MTLWDVCIPWAVPDQCRVSIPRSVHGFIFKEFLSILTNFNVHSTTFFKFTKLFVVKCVGFIMWSLKQEFIDCWFHWFQERSSTTGHVTQTRSWSVIFRPAVRLCPLVVVTEVTHCWGRSALLWELPVSLPGMRDGSPSTCWWVGLHCPSPYCKTSKILRTCFI